MSYSLIYCKVYADICLKSADDELKKGAVAYLDAITFCMLVIFE